MAIAFAAGMFHSQLPAHSDSPVESTDTEIQEIAKDSKMSPKYRALSLLQLANKNIPDSTHAELEAQLSHFWLAEIRRGRASNNKEWDDYDSFTSAHMMFPSRGGIPSDQSGSGSSPIPVEKLAFAKRAVEAALIQLEKSTEKFATLNLYVIASQLFQKTGNTDGVKRCDRILEEAIEACEQNKHIDETQIRATTSALNQMANSLIPVCIPISNPDQRIVSERPHPTNVKPFSQKDFLESEKFKRRAIAIVDRLPPENHLRRKAHRDLVLWYMQLDKNELAEKEKQLLFDLVGIRENSILYPQDGACGHTVWWKKANTVLYMGCGMG